jgi:pimeloyl-ACP methyl ester carboxylesterase
MIGTMGTIRGKVANASDHTGPVIVYRYTKKEGVFSLESKVPADEQGGYRFGVSPGTYYIAAFIDIDQDSVLHQDERWNFYGKPTEITVAAGQTVILETLTITNVPPVLPEGTKYENRLMLSVANIGRVVSLNDPLFNRGNHSLGMWRPLDFLDQIGGGLFFLQDYERDKIPVVLVHGVNGGPDDLKSIIDRLDRKRFQPWVLYYPSGVRLNMVSDYFVKAVTEIQNRFRVRKLIIIGHSMGGLVTRSFVKKYLERYPERLDNLLLVMTINSPMGGMPSASLGLDAPLMIQCWRDLAPDSEFLRELHSWNWPKSIPYHLVFSYKSRSGDDGVVPLQSQIPLKLQQEAVHVNGFNNSHTGTLSDISFLRLLTETLASVQ